MYSVPKGYAFYLVPGYTDLSGGPARDIVALRIGRRYALVSKPPKE